MGSLKIHPQIRIDEYTKSGVWTQDTVQQLLAERVRERGSQLAVVDPVDKSEYVDGVPGRVTWAELDAEVDRLAAMLLRAEVRAGEVVGVQLPNTVEQIAVVLAVWRIGAIVSLLAVHSTEPEIVEVCNESCVSAFVTAARIGSNHVAERVISVRTQIPTLRTVLSYGVGVPGRCRPDRPRRRHRRGHRRGCGARRGRQSRGRRLHRDLLDVRHRGPAQGRSARALRVPRPRAWCRRGGGPHR